MTDINAEDLMNEIKSYIAGVERPLAGHARACAAIIKIIQKAEDEARQRLWDYEPPGM